MTSIKTAAEVTRVHFTAQYEAAKRTATALPTSRNAEVANYLDWQSSVARGLVDDLADFTDEAQAIAFVQRRRARLTADGMHHGASACSAVLAVLGEVPR